MKVTLRKMYQLNHQQCIAITISKGYYLQMQVVPFHGFLRTETNTLTKHISNIVYTVRNLNSHLYIYVQIALHNVYVTLG